MPRKVKTLHIPKEQRTRGPKGPTKFTQGLQDAYIEFIEKGYPKCLASKKVGMSHNTVASFCAAHPEFIERIEEAILIANDTWVLNAENDLKQHSKENIRATEVILYNRAPERWQDRKSKTNITNNNANQQANTDVKLEGQVTEDFIQALLTLDVLEEKRQNGELIEHQPETKGE